ncbi:MAG TPA: M56 family metallopeptidase [Flavobacteriaceae bacterium]|nr:M56 family metallopeptidase [Flavobacteriaceae bacterium]
MIYYFIQLLVFQALFLGVYELFLKKETFFSLNRGYLLITPFLAVVIPFLEFEILQTVVPTSEIVQLPVLFISEGSEQTNIINDGIEGSFSTYSFLKANALTIVYFLGLLLSLVLFTRKLLFLQNRLRNGKIEKRNKVTIVRIPDSRMACSFFNLIFLGENLSEEETKQILAHELAHVEQKHSWDLLWFEILRIVLWFNPFIYRQQMQLSILHEYIADERAVRKFEKKYYFQDLLNATFGTRQISFTNQFFNKSLIKKRIIMLQKPKSNRNAKLKYLLILPLMFAMLTYVACSEDVPTNENQEILPPPPPPGPPTKAYQEYLELKNMLKEEGVDSDMTFEEYQMIIKIGRKPSSSFDIDHVPNVPFTLIDQVPIFPGCENLGNNEAQKECMSQKIAEFVNANFNSSISKNLGLKNGNARIQVLFKINETGKVVEVKARAAHPALESEAIRVVEMLPDMTPGKQNGKPASVLYSLPILFQAE